MNMNKIYLFFASILLAILLNSSVSIYFEVDKQILQTKIYEPTIVKHLELQQDVVLYIDHSTCMINTIVNKSDVFNALRPNLGKYADTLVLIKGRDFEYISNTDKSPTSTTVSNILNNIDRDIPYTDIGEAFNRISKSNSQAVFITDCEYYDRDNKLQDHSPYMTSTFIDWLQKGYSIYIITEPYDEPCKGKIYKKNRFYFIFTDDKLQAPISGLINAEIQDLVDSGICTLFKMTNSDIGVVSPKSDMVNTNLTFKVDYLNSFELISIDDSWKAIQEYVMKLDKYGEPIPGEKPEPLISNIMLNNGENYKLSDIQIVATNITTKYISKDTSVADDLRVILPIDTTEINISDGFILDKATFKNNKLNVMLTDKIFTDGYLFNKKYGGNLIRLDFVITQVKLNPMNSSDFEWQSIGSSNNAICVSKSIDNALLDVNVIPTALNRRVIHTIFIKMESY